MKIISDSFNGLDSFFSISEGSEAEVAFTAWAKASTRGTDNIYFIEKFIEKVPGWHVIWCLKPDIWSIYSSKGSNTCRLNLSRRQVLIDVDGLTPENDVDAERKPRPRRPFNDRRNNGRR